VCTRIEAQLAEIRVLLLLGQIIRERRREFHILPAAHGSISPPLLLPIFRHTACIQQRVFYRRAATLVNHERTLMKRHKAKGAKKIPPRDVF
jgi:hypothetical protein